MERVKSVPNRKLVMAPDRMEFAVRYERAKDKGAHLNKLGDAAAEPAVEYGVISFEPKFRPTKEQIAARPELGENPHLYDPTKLQFNVMLTLVDDAGNEVARTRAEDLTVMNDPAGGIQTPDEFEIEDAIAKRVVELTGKLPAWSARIKGLPSLHKRLAIGDELEVNPDPPPAKPEPAVPEVLSAGAPAWDPGPDVTLQDLAEFDEWKRIKRAQQGARND